MKNEMEIIVLFDPTGRIRQVDLVVMENQQEVMAIRGFIAKDDDPREFAEVLLEATKARYEKKGYRVTTQLNGTLRSINTLDDFRAFIDSK